MRVFLPVVIIVIIVSSCNPTKYVPAGKTLLTKNHVRINNMGVREADLVPYIRQKPNKKIFGARFHLGLYNLSNLEKSRWPHSWLRNIGEEPVIYDSLATEKSKEQITSYVASKGYFDGRVSDTVKTAKRKSEVYYDVKLKTPYIIRNLSYDIPDTSIRALFYFDSVNCMIERGKPYDVDVLQSELSRFERFIKNSGYYGFSSDYVNFLVDSTIGNRQVNIVYTVKNFMEVDHLNRITYVPHSKFRIRNVYVYPDFVPKELLEKGESYLKSMDTTSYKGYYFISGNGGQRLKYDLIIQSLYVKPGSGYNTTDVEQTQSHLMTLKVYRLVNTFFKEVEDPEVFQDPRNPELSLDCFIQLTLLSQQSFNVEVEGTNSAGSLGGALNLIYQHKNLFHGAEQFSMKLKGAFEAVTQENIDLRGNREFGLETTLRLPRFLFPFLKIEGFVKNYNPTTTLLAAYNYQDMVFYRRRMANATFGYNWMTTNYQTHIVNPIQLNLIKLDSIDPAFKARIDSSSYLAYSYRDVMILGGSYSFIFNNQKIQKSRDYWFFRLNAEISGNMLSMVSRLAGLKKSEGSYYVFGQPFAQYFRADMDLRYNIVLNDVSSAVYRGFIGLGIPYGNSKAIPFEKQYFGGGANGIRAWQVRTLGPGSYAVPRDTTFINQTADIKLEANAEYRFKLFWILEGAVFLDAGNIWTFNVDDARPGAQFSFANLLDDLAVGTGTGFRFDFKFVIGRLDLGLKLRDPSIANGSKWIVANRSYNFRNDLTFVVGIGYPF
ncbi:MAG: BamA/TamA family outer membrane protein [Bacteroidales bacterium]